MRMCQELSSIFNARAVRFRCAKWVGSAFGIFRVYFQQLTRFRCHGCARILFSAFKHHFSRVRAQFSYSTRSFLYIYVFSQKATLRTVKKMFLQFMINLGRQREYRAKKKSIYIFFNRLVTFATCGLIKPAERAR